MSSNVAQVIGLNKPAPAQHKPTIVGHLYTAYKYSSQVVKIIQITNPLGAAKVAFETFAVPVAQLSQSPTAEKCAHLGVNILGALTNLSCWVVGKGLHKVADKIVDCVPNTDSWIVRAAKDVAVIATSEFANKGSDYLSTNINAKFADTMNGPGTHTVQMSQEAKSKSEAFHQTRNQEMAKAVEMVEVAQKAESAYANAMGHENRLQQKNQEVSKLFEDPQVLVNNAKNLAEQKGLKNNKDQIALECSRQVNKFSLVDADMDRNKDTFSAAQQGKHGDDALLARMAELQNAVLLENQHILTAAKKNTETAAKERAVTQESVKTVNPNHVRSEKISPGGTAPTPSSVSNSPPSTEEIQSWIQSTYIKNELEAQAASNKKLAIANGMAKSVMEITGETGAAARDHYTHQFLECMDESSKRWYNDVAGKAFGILTGVDTDFFAYKPHGLKKVWGKVTEPVKKVLNEINNHADDQKPVVYGLQVNSGSTVSGTINNKPVVQLYAPKIKPPTQQSPLQVKKPISTTTSEQAAEKTNTSTLNAGILNAGIEETDSINPSVTSPKANIEPAKNSSSNNLSTVNNINTLANAGFKNVFGYSGLSKIGHSLNIFGEINKGYGTAITAWNVAYLTALGINPYVGVAVAITNLYSEHVPKEQVKLMVDTLNSQASYYDGFTRKSLGLNEAAHELRVSATILQNMDNTLRKAHEYLDKPQLTPTKVEQLYTQAIDTRAKLQNQAQNCGTTRSEKAKKDFLSISASTLGIISQALKSVLDDLKK